MFSVTHDREKRWDPPTPMRYVIIEQLHNVDENVNDFQIAKVQPQGVA